MVNIPGPEVGFTDILDYEIKEKLKQETAPKAFPLRPSSAGKCQRQIAYELMEYRGYEKYETEPMEPSVFKLLNLGNSVEFSVIRNLESNIKEWAEITYKQQTVTLFRLNNVKNKKQPLVEGSVDLVVQSPEWLGVMDIKSVKDGHSTAYKSRWQEKCELYDSLESLEKIGDSAWYAPDLQAFLDEVKDPFLYNNFMQLNSYCCSEFFQNRNCTFGSLYRHNKNTSQEMEIRFKPSPELFKKVKDKFNRVNKAVEEKKPENVEKEYPLGSMPCAFCKYQKQCWDGKNALKEWFKTFPAKNWPTNIEKINDNDNLKKLFDKYKNFGNIEKDKKDIEQEIITEMYNKNVQKIQLEDKKIYQLKELKSGLALRRTKL